MDEALFGVGARRGTVIPLSGVEVVEDKTEVKAGVADSLPACVQEDDFDIPEVSSPVATDSDFDDFDTISVATADTEYKKPAIEDYLSIFSSGIGLDISKNHTGVCMWHDGVVETVGFAIDMEYDTSSYLAEATMRKCFKDKLYDILKGRDWEVCIIEDVFGGANFDTVRKLLALNGVLDDLVLEGRLHVEQIYRLKESEWLSGLKEITDIGKYLNAKACCQRILGYLEFPFYMENKDFSEAQKARIFFEDICDATGQLIGLSIRLRRQKSGVKASSVRLSGIRLDFWESADAYKSSTDAVLSGELGARITETELAGTDKLDADFILKKVQEDRDAVYVIPMSTEQLGLFGIKQGFTYFESGRGVLTFYEKGLTRRLQKARKGKRGTKRPKRE